MGAEQRSKVRTSWRRNSAEAVTLPNPKGFHNECTTNGSTPIAGRPPTLGGASRRSRTVADPTASHREGSRSCFRRRLGSVRPPLQWMNETVPDLHPQFGPMDLAGPQRAHPALRIDPRCTMHSGQRLSAPFFRTGADQLGKVARCPPVTNSHSAPPETLSDQEPTAIFACTFC